jgi:hypothetical protein
MFNYNEQLRFEQAQRELAAHKIASDMALKSAVESYQK